MRLTTRGQYALRATLIVACRQRNEKAVSLASIAASEGISQPYLEQLFQRLRKAGIVASIRGPGGGYRMARDSSDIQVLTIIRAVEEEIELPRCASVSREASRCEAAWDCACKDVWDGFMEVATTYFSSFTLADLVEKTMTRRLEAGVSLSNITSQT